MPLYQKCPACGNEDLLRDITVNGKAQKFCATCVNHVLLLGISATVNQILNLISQGLESAKKEMEKKTDATNK